MLPSTPSVNTHTCQRKNPHGKATESLNAYPKGRVRNVNPSSHPALLLCQTTSRASPATTLVKPVCLCRHTDRSRLLPANRITLLTQHLRPLPAHTMALVRKHIPGSHPARNTLFKIPFICSVSIWAATRIHRCYPLRT